MFNSPIIETIISLTLLFFFFSVLVSCVQEGTVSIFKTRGKLLEHAIGEVLNDKFNKNFAYLLYQHPQIDLLKQKQSTRPSYIDPPIFAKALIDLMAAESTETIFLQDKDKDGLLTKITQFKPAVLPALARLAGDEHEARAMSPSAVNVHDRFALGVETLKQSELKRLLNSFLVNDGGKATADPLQDLQNQIQGWFVGYMERVSGWYKRKVRKNIFFASFAVVLILNLNFITIAKSIYTNSSLRDSLLAKASEAAADPNAIQNIKTTLEKEYNIDKENVNAILGAELPIGWKSFSKKENTGLTIIGLWLSYVRDFFTIHLTWINAFGWIIFALALTRGAPFWFDILKKFVNVRNAGISPDNRGAK